MRVTGLELYPGNSPDPMILSYRDPTRQNMYNVKAIEGLDADEIIAKYYKGSGSSKFYNLSLLKRTIVMKIALNPTAVLGETNSTLRDAVYRMISQSRSGMVHLHFMDGTTHVALLSGFVEKMESDLFTKEPEVQITIKCDEPFLKAPTSTSISVGTLDPALTVVDDLLSTAPHGFVCGIEFLDNVPSLSLTDPDDSTWSFEVTPPGGFLTGDIMYMSSALNEKHLYLDRSSVIVYLADTITPGSCWPIMFPGVNKLSLSTPTDVEWTLFSYYPTYWGV